MQAGIAGGDQDAAEEEETTLKAEIEILGKMRPATLITAPLFDPEGERMRG